MTRSHVNCVYKNECPPVITFLLFLDFRKKSLVGIFYDPFDDQFEVLIDILYFLSFNKSLI